MQDGGPPNSKVQMSIKEFYPARFKKQLAVQSAKQERTEQEEISVSAENGEHKQLHLPCKSCGQSMAERIKMAAKRKELPIEDTCTVVRPSTRSSSSNVPCSTSIALEADRGSVDHRSMEELSTSSAVEAIASASAAYSRRVYLESPATSDDAHDLHAPTTPPLSSRMDDAHGKETGRSSSVGQREIGDVNMADVGENLQSTVFLAQSPPRLQHTLLAHPIRRHLNGDLPHHAERRQRSLQTSTMSDEKARRMQMKMSLLCSCEPFNMPMGVRSTKDGLEKLNEVVAQTHNRFNTVASVGSPDRHTMMLPMQGQAVNQDDVTNMLMCGEEFNSDNFDDNMYLSPSDSQRLFHGRFEHSSAPRSDASVRSIQFQHEQGSISPTWGLLHHSPSQGK
mmetsp:Transcript_27449/g.62220  ORF Transcript_27449/g.62220 Transcript_27449/m.62220 type:complete len:394 (-) Transcript_27449:2998-4179(-)|eukprot:747673-Hanusia_phi.AAC.3